MFPGEICEHICRYSWMGNIKKRADSPFQEELELNEKKSFNGK
jgi:hypothetical protein